MTARSSSPDSATSPVLLRGDIEGIALLLLNRPQARNTLSEAMLATLYDQFAAIAKDDQVRAVIISHNGPAFCAGHDMKEMTAHRSDPDRGRSYFKALMERCSALMLSIQKLPQPVIAAVEGVATAAGCQLAGSVASTVNRTALSRNVANKHAMEMLLTGEIISAADAHRIGLVNRVVPAGEASEYALELARQIASKSMLTVKLGKEAFYRQRELNLADDYKLTIDVMVENMLARDAEEGLSAFIEKRDPTWEDR